MREYNWERWEIESRLCLWKKRLILMCSWLREKQEYHIDSHSAGVQMVGTKYINTLSHTHILQVNIYTYMRPKCAYKPVNSSTNTDRKIYECFGFLCFRLSGFNTADCVHVLLSYCVWTGYIHHNQQAWGQALVTPWNIPVTSFRWLKAKNNQTLKKSLSY